MGYYEKRIDVNPQDIIIGTHKFNHRRIFINEVCFDVDCHVRILSDKIHDFISSNLIKDNISHQVWDTSRSPHIHCFFKDMNLYSQEIRRDIRLLILKHYSDKYFNWIDKSKASENNMIRDFGGLHEITGKPKTLIYEFKGVAEPSYNGLKPQSPYMENDIKQEILEQLRVLYSQHKLPEIAHNEYTDSDKKAMQEFISYCCENQHTHDGRKRILLKNIAIACLLLDLDTNARHRIYYKITQNCRGCHVNKLIGWDVWAQKQRDLHINWKEIMPFYKKGISIS